MEQEFKPGLPDVSGEYECLVVETGQRIVAKFEADKAHPCWGWYLCQRADSPPITQLWRELPPIDLARLAADCKPVA